MIPAALLWLALAIVPGTAILRLVRVRLGFWVALAATPTVGFGFVYLIALLASRTRLPVVTSVIVVIVALLVAWLAEELRRARTGSSFQAALRGLGRGLTSRMAGRSAAEYVSWILVAGGVIFGVVIWYTVQRGLDFPPGWDSMHHGFFTRQILNYQTLNSSTVLASSPGLADGGSSFYPLIFNLIAAVVQTLSGAAVSHVILAGIVAIGALFTPVTVFALARLIEPSRHLVAGVAAIIVPLPIVTYAIIGTGRDNAVLGLAVVLGTAAVLVATFRSRWIGGVIAGLSLVGITGLHSSELPVAIFVAGGIATVRAVHSRQFAAFGRWVIRSILITLGAIIVLVLLEPAVLTAASSRSGAMQSMLGHPPFTLWSALVHTGSLGWDRTSGQPPLLQILIILGLLLPIFVRKLRPYLAATVYYAVFGLLMIGMFTETLGPLTFLTAPWYQDLNRLAWTYPILGAIPAAVALVATLELLARPVVALGKKSRYIADRARKLVILKPVAVSLACVLVLLIFAHPRANTTNVEFHTFSAPAGADSRVVFKYLQSHIEPKSVVMDDLRISGSLWMYNDYSVRPLFGNAPYLGGASKSWKERLWLRDNFAKIASDPCVNAMLKKYHVQYVYYDEAKIFDGVRKITRATLDHNREFTPYYSSGPVAVYSVKLPSHLQPCTKDVSSGMVWN